MTVVSLDEHRAQRQAENAHLDYLPLPIDEALPHARRILAMLEREHHVEPDHGTGACSSCGLEAPVRFTYGTLTLCRPCRQARLRAARQADLPLPAGPPAHDPLDELLAKARRWIPRVAGTLPLDQIELALRRSGLTKAHVYELVDQAADIANNATSDIRHDAHTGGHADAPNQMVAPR